MERSLWAAAAFCSLQSEFLCAHNALSLGARGTICDDYFIRVHVRSCPGLRPGASGSMVLSASSAWWHHSPPGAACQVSTMAGRLLTATDMTSPRQQLALGLAKAALQPWRLDRGCWPKNNKMLYCWAEAHCIPLPPGLQQLQTCGSPWHSGPLMHAQSRPVPVDMGNLSTSCCSCNGPCLQPSAPPPATWKWAAEGCSVHNLCIQSRTIHLSWSLQGYKPQGTLLSPHPFKAAGTPSLWRRSQGASSPCSAPQWVVWWTTYGMCGASNCR